MPLDGHRARAGGLGRDDAADPGAGHAAGGARSGRRAARYRASPGSRSPSRAAGRSCRCPTATATSASCSRVANPRRRRSSAARRARRARRSRSHEGAPRRHLRARPAAAARSASAGRAPPRARATRCGRSTCRSTRGIRRWSSGPTRWRSRCPCTPRPGCPRSRTAGSTVPSAAFGLTRRSATTSRPRWSGMRPLPGPQRLLPSLDRYARLDIGDEERLVGCGPRDPRLRAPVPPLPGPGGVRRTGAPGRRGRGARRHRPARGRRRRHITFGDPDFLNAPPHVVPHRGRRCTSASPT